MNRTALQVSFDALRAERDWQIQSARLYRNTARLRLARPVRNWTAEPPVTALLVWASQAVHRARLANYELIALRQLRRERLRSLAARPHPHTVDSRGTHYAREALS